MPTISDYPLIGCGYAIPRENMKEIYWGDQPRFDWGKMAFRLTSWDIHLPDEIRGTVPLIRCLSFNFSQSLRKPDLLRDFGGLSIVLYRDKERSIDNADYFILTRLVRCLTVKDVDERLVETEEDKKVRKKFVDVFGKGIDENQLTFFMSPWKHEYDRF